MQSFLARLLPLNLVVYVTITNQSKEVSFEDQNASQDDHPWPHETLEGVVSFQDQNASQDDHPWTNEWQMPEPVNLDKSGLQRSSRLMNYIDIRPSQLMPQ
jgi:hypothetical protein